jgi:hypothetical protein
MAGRGMEELELLNAVYDSLFKALQTTDVGSDKQTFIDKTTVTNVIYIGLGAKGLATSANGWLLTKIDKTGTPITIKHAIDAWDNYKTTAVYS